MEQPLYTTDKFVKTFSIKWNNLFILETLAWRKEVYFEIYISIV